MPVESWMLELEPELLLEALPGPLREAMEGWDSHRMAEYLERHQGQSIYLPRLDYLVREIKYQRIRDEFNGINHRDLARRYSLSLTQVYRVVAPDGPGSEMEQEDLFS